MILVHHAERCPPNPKLQAFVAWWQTHGPFAITIIYGSRTDADQAELYAQGRTAPGKIVTNAKTAGSSAHGHDAAIDAHPVRDTYATGGVRLIWTGDETDPAEKAECDRLFAAYIELGKMHGLESGENFPGLRDRPHLQDPEWHSLPLAKGATS